MRSKNIVLFCARYNQAAKNKDFAFEFLYSKKIVEFLYCLERNRLIQSYTCDLTFAEDMLNHFIFYKMQTFSSISQLFNLKIYPLYYSYYSLFSHLSYKSTKKHVFGLSLIDITKFQRYMKNMFSPLLVIETNQGCCIHTEAIKKAKGGRLLCILYFYV